MRKLAATFIILSFSQIGLLRAQTSGVPPVEACKPGDFTVIGWPNEFGPKRDQEFVVLIDDDFNGNFLTQEPIWVPAIERTVPKWNDIAGAGWEFKLQGLTSEDAVPFDGKLTISPCGVLFPCPDEPPPSIPPGPDPPDFEPDPFNPAEFEQGTTIAVTLISSEGGGDKAIGNADIFFNPVLPIHTEPRSDQIDFESVLLHELGHALGLDHNDNCVVGPSVMESLINLGEMRRDPLSPEIEGVKFLYPADDEPAVRIFERDTKLRFDAVEGGLPPFAQPISVFGKGGTRWVPTATTSDGGDWVRFDPEAGRFPLTGTLSVSVDPSSLPPGDYQATVSINIEDHPGPPATAEIELHVAEAGSVTPPLLTRAGIVNSANMSSPRLAPGSLFTLFGQFLAPATDEALSTPLPERLGGVEVLVNGVAAPLFFVSPTQINGQVPVDLATGRGGIVVRNGMGQTPPIPVDLTASAPELFVIDGDQALVLNQDNTVNSSQNPALAGSAVSLFFSGQGAVSPPATSGRAAPVNPLSRVIDFSSVEVGGQPGRILFLGLAPGFVGLGQANLELPTGLSGQLEVQLTIGENTSNVGLVSVQ